MERGEIGLYIYCPFAPSLCDLRCPLWLLYAGYDAGTTGPERHPSVFSVVAVAAENSLMPGDVFVFYKYVAEAIEVEDDMAKALIGDLARLCDNPAVSQAAGLVARADDEHMTEMDAWKFRRPAGQLIPSRRDSANVELSRILNDTTQAGQSFALPREFF